MQDFYEIATPMTRLTQRNVKFVWSDAYENSFQLLKDYDCDILYHPGKANVVAGALSRKSSGSLAHISVERRPLIQELHELVDQGLMMKLSRS